MRTIISAIYLFSMLCWISPLSAQVTFTANDASVNCDATTFCVDIEVSDFDSITGMQFTYEWDTTIMFLDSQTDFLPVGGIFNEDSASVGKLQYSWITLLDPFLSLPDGSVIAELCFTVNNLGTTTLDFGPIIGSTREVNGYMNGVNTQNIPAVFNAGTITVEDTTDPVIVCPADTMITSSGTNVWDIAPVSATDNCVLDSVTYLMDMGGPVGSGMDDASGEFFMEGTTTVTYTAYDDAGNTGSCSFDVTLTAPPVSDTILQFIPFVTFDCINNTVSIDVRVTNFDSITGMQWGMRWDTLVLDYLPPEIDNLPPVASYNENIENGAILFTWFSFSTPSTSLPDSTTIFTLNFDLIGSYSSPGITFEDFSMAIPILIGDVNGNMTQGVDFEFLPEVVNVIDNEAPMIVTPCPTDTAVGTDLGVCEATVSWTPPTFTDNCSIDSIVASHNPGDVFPVGTTLVTYTATDFAGNSVSCSFNVTVSDNEDPTITCPPDITVSADPGVCQASSVSLGSATTSDNCPGETSSNNGLAIYPVGTTMVTWTVTDAAGNTATCNQFVTVEDNENPTITCPADITVSADAGVCQASGVSLGTATTSDNCLGETTSNDAPAAFPVGTTTVTWTVTDAFGNTATCTQQVTVTDDENPTITCPADLTVNVDGGTCTASGVSLGSPTTNDNCGVAGVTDDAPAVFPLGNTTVTYTVTDVNGNTNTCTQSVLVVDNENPTITCPPDITANIDSGTCLASSVSLGTPTTGDNCSVADTSNDAPADFPIGTTTVTWTVTDGSGNTATCTQMVTVNDIDAPIVTCPPLDAFDTDPGMCSVVVTNNLAPHVTECSPYDINYTITGSTSGSGNDDATGTEFNVGISIVTYVVTDTFGNVDSCNFIVQVNDNQAPVINCPSDTSIIVPVGTTDTVVNNIDVSALDNCALGTITYSTDNGMSGSGNISGSSFPVGLTTVTYVVSDTTGNVDSCSFMVNIAFVNSNLIDCPPDQTHSNGPDSCSTIVNGIAPIIVTDPGLIAGITYELTDATTGSGVNDASGNEFNVGTTTVEYIATDIFGNMDTCTFVVTVEDTELPTWNNCPANIVESVNLIGDCRAVVSWSIPLPDDNCGVTNIIASHSPNDTFNLGTTNVSYAALDAAGNVGICSFIVIVEDNTPPTISCPSDTTVTVDAGMCSAIVNWTPATAMDDCSPTMISCTHNPGDAYPVGTTTVVCTASDAAGNVTTCSFTITVLDQEAPAISGCPADLTINTDQNTCEAIFSWTEPVFSDLCSNPVAVSSTHSPGDTFQIGTTSIFYIGVDAAGNSATCSFNVTVLDNQPPVINCPADTVIQSLPKECGAIFFWDPSEVSASDICDNSVPITSDVQSGTFFPVGTTTVTFTATDNAGNTATCSFDVTVEDNVAPVFDCSDDIVISADGTVITDNSGLVFSSNPDGTCENVLVDFNDPTVLDNCPGLMVNMTSGLPSGSFFPIGTTAFVYEAEDAAGNMAVCAFNLTVVPLDPVEIFINPGDTVCTGDNVQFSTNVMDAGASFIWENAISGWTSIDAEPIIPNVALSDGGFYSVTITLSSGCTTFGSATLTVIDAPTVNASSNGPLCEGEDLELMVDVDPGATVIAYNWTGPGFSSMDQNPIIPEITLANAGVYTVEVLFDNGCTASMSINVQIVQLSAPTITSSCEQTICLGESCVLTGTQYTPAPDSYIWEVSSPAGGLPNDTDNNQITVTPTQPGIYIYNYSVESNGCVSDSATIVIIVEGDPTAVFDEYEIDYETETTISVIDNDTFSLDLGFTISVVTQPENGTLVNNGDGTFTYTPDLGFLGTDQFAYELCNACELFLCNTAIVNLEVTDDGDCVIPTLITPNSDGVNDKLFINCLETGNFPNNSIVIFNQWGTEVFQATPYQNNWEGTWEGKDLPDGTYFYIFKLDSSADPEKGYLTIFR